MINSSMSVNESIRLPRSVELVAYRVAGFIVGGEKVFLKLSEIDKLIIHKIIPVSGETEQYPNKGRVILHSFAAHRTRSIINGLPIAIWRMQRKTSVCVTIAY